MKRPPNVAPIYLPLGRIRSPTAVIHRAYNQFILHKHHNGPARRMLLKDSLTWPADACALIWKSTERYHAYVSQVTGKSRLRQILDQGRLVFGLSLPPDAYMKFQLYDDARMRVASEYLHRYETKYFLFPVLNRHADRKIANDKALFFEFCRRHGFPTATLIATLPDGARDEPDIPERDLISKPRIGKGGRDVTRWRFHDGAYLRVESGPRYSATELLALLRQEAAIRGPLLLQVARRNHSDIEDLGRGVLTTARIMTCRRVNGNVEACCAVFRIPTSNSSIDNFHAGGVAAPIDMSTGTLSAAISLRPRSPRLDHVPGFPDIPITGRVLPHFRAAVDLVEKAHQELDGYIILGWDVGLTENGPCLIETNSGPCVDTIQRPHGKPIGAMRLGELLREQWDAVPTDEAVKSRVKSSQNRTLQPSRSPA